MKVHHLIFILWFVVLVMWLFKTYREVNIKRDKALAEKRRLELAQEAEQGNPS